MRYIPAICFFLIAGLPYIAMLRSGGKEHVELASRKAEVLSIMSPHRREEKLEYSRGFSEWMSRQHHRDVEIRWLDVGGTSKILKELESRFAASPDDPGVDLLFGGGVAPYMTAVEHGWLQQLDVSPAILEKIPSVCAGTNVRDPDRRWFGVALSGFGILYNRPVLHRLGLKEPQNWDDLGRSEYLSWVASGDPRSSGSVHICYEIILQAYGFEKGWDLITRICANVRRFGESSAVVPHEVAAGEVVAGMVVDMSARTVIDAIGRESLTFVLPQKTTMIGPDAIGAIKGGRNLELSRMFVEYALSPEGQRVLFQPVGANGQKHALHRMPVARELYSEPGAPDTNPYSYPEGLRYDDAKGSKRYSVLNDLMGIWLIDAQSDLQGAWKKIIDKGCPPDLVAQLCATPLTEAELMVLAVEWQDSRLRQEVTQRWSVQAQERYKRLSGI